MYYILCSNNNKNSIKITFCELCPKNLEEEMINQKAMISESEKYQFLIFLIFFLILN